VKAEGPFGSSATDPRNTVRRVDAQAITQTRSARSGGDRHGVDGLARASDLPYLWPSRLRRPDDDTRLVYLDLNHWISLARAATGHADDACG
jgi:hypothetical protein